MKLINKNELKNNNIKNDGIGNNKKWLILNKKNLEIYKEEKKREKEIENESNISYNELMNCYKKMSMRWNNYRDEINNLIGDISPYYNYKLEIQKIVIEENQILEQIYGNNQYYSSDDEYNDYDNDDYFYYK